jgi:hypothetical protein
MNLKKPSLRWIAVVAVVLELLGLNLSPATGTYVSWRKNRQPNSGTSAIGTDLNRNWDYRWGCCGGSSGSAGSATYRGPSAFSDPETPLVRDFVDGRVIDGKQQITMAIDFHAYGELILWPLGYTFTDVPGDMTQDDHDALAAIGQAMAGTNGYTPQQASDLYITDSTSGSPRFCVALSWDGGVTWTATRTSATLSTAETTYILGGVVDPWGRTWSADELNNANFRVRLTSVASNTSRDFSLDWVAVRVRYLP